ncbi:putative diaphanous [Histomonas meleagridis]|uniref:putative diaphanous n=1 Tax=Histomonas meleagridis TaxID=135588 RepID=UPI0035596A9D|nr:putative diaphanous [Histomonas meleagridis]KAH0806642.1 putative diaphanous [Histomonas meleagridis]
MSDPSIEKDSESSSSNKLKHSSEDEEKEKPNEEVEKLTPKKHKKKINKKQSESSVSTEHRKRRRKSRAQESEETSNKTQEEKSNSMKSKPKEVDPVLSPSTSFETESKSKPRKLRKKKLSNVESSHRGADRVSFAVGAKKPSQAVSKSTRSEAKKTPDTPHEELKSIFKELVMNHDYIMDQMHEAESQFKSNPRDSLESQHKFIKDFFSDLQNRITDAATTFTQKVDERQKDVVEIGNQLKIIESQFKAARNESLEIALLRTRGPFPEPKASEMPKLQTVSKPSTIYLFPYNVRLRRFLIHVGGNQEKLNASDLVRVSDEPKEPSFLSPLDYFVPKHIYTDKDPFITTDLIEKRSAYVRAEMIHEGMPPQALPLSRESSLGIFEMSTSLSLEHNMPIAHESEKEAVEDSPTVPIKEKKKPIPKIPNEKRTKRAQRRPVKGKKVKIGVVNEQPKEEEEVKEENISIENKTEEKSDKSDENDTKSAEESVKSEKESEKEVTKSDKIDDDENESNKESSKSDSSSQSSDKGSSNAESSDDDDNDDDNESSDSDQESSRSDSSSSDNNSTSRESESSGSD